MGAMQERRIVVVTPVLNDWASFRQLVAEMAGLKAIAGDKVHVIAVDDGSTEVEPPGAEALVGPIQEIRVLRLQANMGHQRAIALGLAYAQRELDFDFAVVMDSDGEDRPADVELLIAAHTADPGSIIVAQRSERSEGLLFRTFYQFYKVLFRRLTGKGIAFGNFSLIPKRRLGNVIFNPGIWNNLPATMLRARIPIEMVATKRGERYFGSSKMGFTSLMLHGMSAISVFSDIVIGRLIVGMAMLALLLGAGVIGTLYLKYQTTILVPGYATTVILILSSTLVNAIMVGFLSIMSLLAARSQLATMPSELVGTLVAGVDIIRRTSEGVAPIRATPLR